MDSEQPHLRKLCTTRHFEAALALLHVPAGKNGIRWVVSVVW